MIGSQLQKNIKMLLCSILHSAKTLISSCIFMQVPLYSGNHPRGVSFSGILKFLFDKWRRRVGVKKKKKTEICCCRPSFTGLLSHHFKCMQSYSCAAAPLVHADAQALTDALVWKYHIDMLTWDMYWLQFREGWLFSKELILIDMLPRWYWCILSLFGALTMSWKCSAFKLKKIMT